MTNKVYICGICGTFMAGIAQIAKQLGYEVHGCDENVYPPMSTLLQQQGIEIDTGYHAAHLQRANGDLIIGNALGRGNALVEAALNERRHLQSGPAWLHQHVLLNKLPIAVAGTHGKTSTASMLTWILEFNDGNPSYLIGGRPGNFSHSARLTDSEYFVIEADEYDTAFFDKRSKFVHYQPHGVVLNNLEFDHADIFNDLAQIQNQFHHLLRLVPQNGFVIVNQDDENLKHVLDMGCYSDKITTSIKSKHANWYAEKTCDDFSSFTVFENGAKAAQVNWQCIGDYNMQNALNAIAAAAKCGITATQSAEALQHFIASARRLQKLAEHDNVILFEDFAHHPTAIRLTLLALRSKYPKHKLIALLEPRSNTMRGGYHQHTLGEALNAADCTFLYEPTALTLDTASLQSRGTIHVIQSKQQMIDEALAACTDNSVMVCLSNGSFDAIPQTLCSELSIYRN